MSLRDALTSGQTLLMDGAIGTELIRRGFTAESWRANVEAPDLVRAIHGDYVHAGADVLITNSFLLKPAALGDERLTDMGRAAIRLAHSVGPRWLLGSIAPETATGANFDNPDSLLATTQALYGVDAILLETCSDASAFAAAAWVHARYPELPVLVSFAFAPNEDAKACEWARLAQASDVAALGVNCGREQAPAEIGRILGLFRSATTKPLFARPNAGTPKRMGDLWTYPLGPEEWAAATGALCKQGLAMIGGCCGTTPEHIRALSSKMKEPPRSIH